MAASISMKTLRRQSDAERQESEGEPQDRRSGTGAGLRETLLKVLAWTIPEMRARPPLVRSLSESDDTVDSIDLKVREGGKEAFSLHVPAAIPLLSAAQLITFCFYAARLGNVTFSGGGVDYNSPLLYVPERRHEAWRFLSYALMHSGYFHLLTNLMVQLLLGLTLELYHSWTRISPVLLLGIVAGSLASSVCDPAALLVGGSGGVYALLGAHLATVVINWAEMQRDVKNIDWLQWRKATSQIVSSGAMRLVIVLAYLALDTGIAVYNRYANSGGSNISYAAHAGGLVAGLLVGVLLLTNLQVRPWERNLGIACAAAYAGLVLGAVLFNILCIGRGLCPDVVLSSGRQGHGKATNATT